MSCSLVKFLGGSGGSGSGSPSSIVGAGWYMRYMSSRPPRVVITSITMPLVDSCSREVRVGLPQMSGIDESKQLDTQSRGAAV